MRKDLLITALGLCLASAPAAADVLATPESDPAVAQAPRPELPAKGTTMAVVEKKFGAPANKRAPVGGDTPKHPPITRWDYAGFSVFFEHDRVVDAVIPGAPPRVYHQDQLTPVASSATPLPPPPAETAPPAAAPPEEAPVVPEAPPAPPAEPAAEAAAAPIPPAAEPMPPAEPASPPPPATPETYPDRPPTLTPAEEIPEDAPPTPK